MQQIAAADFVRRMKEYSLEPDKRFAFFLGAGCSISSGIPAAAALVRNDWLPRLKAFGDPNHPNAEEWARSVFPDFDPDDPAHSYGPVMEKLFLNNAEDRQSEIERLCDGKNPAFGYACLAALVARDGGRFNVVLTTNFDDLAADALYLYTSARPRVITHEALAGFIRSTTTRPLIVKLHGDHRLAPKNTADETDNLQKTIQERVSGLLHDRGLVFLGYGGNDGGIARLLQELPADALPRGIFWVSEHPPLGALLEWLEERGATWVEHADFDQLMVLFHAEFELSHPDGQRFEKIFENYIHDYEHLRGEISALPIGKAGADAIKEASTRVERGIPSWIVPVAEARRLSAKGDLDGATDSYEQALRESPDSAPLIGYYARFLSDEYGELSEAEAMYERAIAADPNHATNLSQYARFLKIQRKDFDRAEAMYERAIAADPDNSNVLNNYANFLKIQRKDFDRAEAMYERAIAADPNNANHLNKYANFLKIQRKDFDRAEAMYERAIAGDPNNTNVLNNYARFLKFQRKDFDRAEAVYERAIVVDPNNAKVLGNFALFLRDQRVDAPRAEEFLKRAIAAGYQPSGPRQGAAPIP